MRAFSASVKTAEAATSKIASTRVSVFWACCPPGPLERDVRSVSSASGIASPRRTRIDSGRMAAILLDIDGVLHVSGEPVAGGGDAVRALRADGHRLRFVTNNTTRAREQLAGELRQLGIELDTDELTTTPVAAARRLAGKRVLALTMAAVKGDLAADVELVERDAEVVLLGGADESEETGRVFGYENLNRAFAELERGARLVCLHKNRWWQTARGPLLDAGAYVSGLEYAAGVEAEVVGKPTRAYFEAALAELGASAGEAVMVGDDVEADIGGAKAAGLRAVLVRTGKFREETLAAAEVQPDGVVESIADLPTFLREPE
jgi:HAD superfamily hydrolase (TIGR01458 family)